MKQNKGTNQNLSKALDIFNENKETYIKDWLSALRFPSISPGNNNEKECFDCAEFFKNKLEKIGFKSKLVLTNGNPVVFGEYKVSDNLESILIYGHYDVQPVNEEKWNTSPFVPEIIGERVYARGAHDDKGQVMYVISALSALIKQKKNENLGYNIKIILDGEEECGSENTAQIFTLLKKELKSDYLLVCDSSTTSKNDGGIVLGLRGVCSFRVKLQGAKTGFHSGEFGGVLKNPAMELSKLLSTLQYDDGRIAVDGFYEGVESFENIPYERIVHLDAKKCFKNTGAYPTGGEQYISNPKVRSGFRPTLDILYMSSGAKDEKDVSNSIPPSATAIISCRLVGSQVPEKIYKVLKMHLEANNKSGMKLSVEKRGEGATAYKISENSLGVAKAERILGEICKKVNYIYEGGSIPFIKDLAKFIKNEPILVGFGLEEDNIHADNESFSIEQFKKGFLFIYLFLLADK